MINLEYLYFHFNIADSKSIISSLRLPVDLKKVTISEIKEIAETGLNASSSSLKYKVEGVSKSLGSKSLDDYLLSNIFFENTDDVFVRVKIDKTIPVEQTKVNPQPQTQPQQEKKVEAVKEKQKEKESIKDEKKDVKEKTDKDKDDIEAQFYNEYEEPIKQLDPFISGNTELTSKVDDLHFQKLDKYLFYDADDKYVKIQVTLPKANEIKPENIVAEFKQDSFIIKVIDFHGSNYKYGVPELSLSINPEGCKVLTKPNYLLIKLRKIKDGQHWRDLHRIKGIGDDMSY